jgi:SAM-dependent methyltransferase
MLSLERQEEYRRRYAAENPGWRPATHVYRDLVAEHLAPPVRMLDLGCGRGGIVEQFDLGAGSVVGLDADLESLRTHRVAGFTRVQGLSEALPYRDGAFDLVCCSWVLEHLALPAGTLREAARLLAPGGRFFFVTPNRHHPLVQFNHALRWTQGRLVDRLYDRVEADTFPAYYRANTARHIRRLLQEAGLELRALIRVGDPTYLAFGKLLYRLASGLERLLPSSLRIHIVGEAYKPARPPRTHPRLARV